MLDAVVGHLLDRFGQEGMPVAVSPVDGQLRSVRVEFLDQGDQQGPVLGIQRALTTEEVVVLGHLQHPLVGDVLAT